MRWLYKDMQMNSKAYGESIFSINELKRIIESDGFYFHGSFNGSAVVQAGLNSFKAACKEVLESSPCSPPAGFACAAGLL